jgi:hypothetical protein
MTLVGVRGVNGARTTLSGRATASRRPRRAVTYGPDPDPPPRIAPFPRTVLNTPCMSTGYPPTTPWLTSRSTVPATRLVILEVAHISRRPARRCFVWSPGSSQEPNRDPPTPRSAGSAICPGQRGWWQRYDGLSRCCEDPQRARAEQSADHARRKPSSQTAAAASTAACPAWLSPAARTTADRRSPPARHRRETPSACVAAEPAEPRPGRGG